MNYIISTVYSLVLTGTIIGGVSTRTVDIPITPTENTSIQYQLGDQIPQEVIDSLIHKYAPIYGADEYGMKRTIWCESFNYNVQSNVVKNGIREPSYGIAQIHEPSHPDVTREQALTPEFAIEFMAKNWGKVKWYGWNSKTDSCNPVYQN